MFKKSLRMPRAHYTNTPGRDQHGFTLIELVALLVMLGIACAIVVTKSFSVATYESAGEWEMVKQHLGHARTRAMNTDSAWGINFNTDKEYWLFQGVEDNRIRLPAEDEDSVTLNRLTIDSAPQTVTFDEFGSPGDNGITIGTSGEDITITGETGFIP